MKTLRVAVLALPSVLVLLFVAAPLSAATLGGGSLYTPRVPISAFGLARNWIDPSRLHVTSALSVGSTWGSRGTSALQTTTLSYRFGAPLAMSVSLGNAWGSTTSRSSSSFFLQGLSVAYRPTRTMSFQFQFEDLRSPLQYSRSGFGGISRWGD